LDEGNILLIKLHLIVSHLKLFLMEDLAGDGENFKNKGEDDLGKDPTARI
jgi:hypothetical protein